MTALEKLTWLESWYNENKADLQGQPALVKAIKANTMVQRIIESLYFQLFNKPLNGCGSCLADGLATLLHYSRKNIKAIMNCRFKLKAGVLLADPFNALPMVTSGNLTDELAIAYLKANPARISMFSEVPNDLDELLKDDGGIIDETKNVNDAGSNANNEGENAVDEAMKNQENGEVPTEGENAVDTAQEAVEGNDVNKGKTSKKQ